MPQLCFPLGNLRSGGFEFARRVLNRPQFKLHFAGVFGDEVAIRRTQRSAGAPLGRVT